MDGIRHRVMTGLLVTLAGAFCAQTAVTIPRYSARYEQDCNLCHFNPTGGGERSTYASQFIVPQEMSIHRLSDEEMAKISPQVSEALTVGTELRTMFFKSDLDDPFAPRNPAAENFFEMQGNLYIALQMTDRLSAHMSRGLSTTSEVFGLAYVLPANGYFKIGRFTPDFGWRVSDHTSFTRDYLGFFPPAHTDVGIEAGLYPGALSFTASVTNGQLGSTRDLDDRLAVTARAAGRLNLEGVGLSLGASFYRNETTFTGRRTAYGPFGYIKAGKLTWMGDMAFADDKPAGGGPTKTSRFMSHELAYPVIRGVDVVATFNHLDPDVDADTGTLSRYGAGLQTMPYPFLILDLSANLYDVREGGAGTEIGDPDYAQGIFQVHFFY